MKKIYLMLLCVCFTAFVSGCNQKAQVSSTDIYIPVLGDEAWLTADGSFMNGVDMAIEELNQKYKDTGYHVRTSIVDDKAIYETGVEMATKLSMDEAVTAVFCLQNFDVSKTTAGILSESDKLTLFPYGAYDSIFQRDNSYLFCGVPAFANLGEAMAKYAVENNYKRIAVYHNGIQSQEELVAAFELALINTDSKVVDYVPQISSSSEFDDIYNRWSALGVDCVVISQYGLDEAYDVLNMIRKKDKNIAIIGEPIFNRANALEENKEAAEGMAVPSTLVMEESQKLNDFKARYQERYQKEADIWAVQGYDMLSLVMDTAVRLHTNNPTEIAKAIQEDGYQGVGRQIAFRKGGAMVIDVNKLPMQQCKDGRFQ